MKKKLKKQDIFTKTKTFIFLPEKRTVGVDIGTRNIKMAAVKDNKVLSVSSAPIPDGVISDGNIEASDLLVKSIRACKNKLKGGARKVTLCLSGKDIILKQIKLPQMKEDQVLNNIKTELSNLYMLANGDYVTDYRILSLVNDEITGEASMNVLVVAAPKILVSDYIKVFKKAGIKIERIDVCPNSHTKFIKLLYENELRVKETKPKDNKDKNQKTEKVKDKKENKKNIEKTANSITTDNSPADEQNSDREAALLEYSRQVELAREEAARKNKELEEINEDLLEKHEESEHIRKEQVDRLNYERQAEYEKSLKTQSEKRVYINSKLEELLQVKAELISELDGLKASYSTLVASQEYEKNEKVQMISEKQQEIAALENEKDNLSEILGSIQTELDRKKKEYDNDLSNYNREVNKLQADSKENSKKIGWYFGQSLTDLDDVEDYYGKTGPNKPEKPFIDEETNAKVDGLKHQIFEINVRIKDLNDFVEGLKDDEDKNLEIHALETNIAERDNRFTSISSEIARLQVELNEIENTVITEPVYEDFVPFEAVLPEIREITTEDILAERNITEPVFEEMYDKGETISVAPSDMLSDEQDDEETSFSEDAGTDYDSYSEASAPQFTEDINFADPEEISAFSNVCLVDIGYSVSNVTFIHKGEYVLHKNIRYGGEAISEALAEKFSIDQKEAENRKLSANKEESNTLLEYYESIVTELDNTMYYYKSINRQKGVDSIILSGGSSHHSGIKEYFASQLSVPVYLLSEVSLLKFVPGKNSPKKKSQYLEDYSSAVAVTIREDWI